MNVEHVPPEDVEVMPKGFAKQLAWDELYRKIVFGSDPYPHYPHFHAEEQHDESENQRTATRSNRTKQIAP